MHAVHAVQEKQNIAVASKVTPSLSSTCIHSAAHIFEIGMNGHGTREKSSCCTSHICIQSSVVALVLSHRTDEVTGDLQDVVAGLLACSSEPPPLQQEMGCHQPARATWSSLPEPLAERILQQAFHNSGRALPQWLQLSLVCKCGRRS